MPQLNQCGCNAVHIPVPVQFPVHIPVPVQVSVPVSIHIL